MWEIWLRPVFNSHYGWNDSRHFMLVGVGLRGWIMNQQSAKLTFGFMLISYLPIYCFAAIHIEEKQLISITKQNKYVYKR